MAFNKNELILDRVRSATVHDLETKQMLIRLTSLEEPSIQTNAESEEVTDALGSLITTLYRAKRGTFSASNSLFSFDLAAAQYGTKKEVAGEDGLSIDVPTFEIVPVKNGTTVELVHPPIAYDASTRPDGLLYVYALNLGEISETYKLDEHFTVADNTITFKDAITAEKVYVEYIYTENGSEDGKGAMRVINSTENFPEAVSLKIFAYFRDKCNEKLYSGAIICPKAKLSPESIELALTSTGKHPFEFTMLKDYCEDDAELFTIVIAGTDA